MTDGATAAGRRALGRRLPSLKRTRRRLLVRRSRRSRPSRLLALRPSPRLRRVLAVLGVLLLLLAAGYRLWLRDSSLVSVERVAVSGLTTEDAKRLRTALVSTAQTMTTLNVDRDRLEEVTAGYPAVRALEVTTDLPHTLRIRVVEHRPVAMVTGAGGRVPVAADGTVLRALPVRQPLPTIRSQSRMRGDRLAGRLARASTRVAAAAPAPLRRRTAEVERDAGRGLVARLRDGPELVFGGSRALRPKWAAAARVLADPDAAGVDYVDLRVPGRPAAGTSASASTAP